MTWCERRLVWTALAAACLAPVASGQPQVPLGYAVEEYVRVPGAKNPVALAFVPRRGPFAYGGELLVCCSSRPAVYRVPAKGKAVLYLDRPDIHSDMVFSTTSSGFGQRLYAPEYTSLFRYEPNLACVQFAHVGQVELMALAFGPGGRWGRSLYLVESAGMNEDGDSIHRFEPNGAWSYLIRNLPENVKGLAFSPGGAWGDYLYICSGAWAGEASAVRRVDPNGVLSNFVAGNDKLGTGMLLHVAFDRRGFFGGCGLFVSSMEGNRIYRLEPNGAVGVFATGFEFEGAIKGNISTGDILFGPDGAMYVADGGHDTVWRIWLNRLGLRRDSSADTLVLSTGQTLRGAVTNQRFTLDCAFRKLELKADGVIGMTSEPDGAVRCLLSDGQIVRGRLLDGPIHVAQADGGRRSVAAGEFRQWARRVSPERPAVGEPSGPLLVTSDGQELAIDANEASLVLASRWGHLRLNCRDLVDLSIEPAAEDAAAPPPDRATIRTVRFTNGSVLRGALAGGKVVLTARLGGRLELDPQQVVLVRSGRPEQPAPWRAQLRLAGGEVLVGSLSLPAIPLRTQAGVVGLPADSIREVSRVAGPGGELRVKLWDGSEIVGRLEEAQLRFRILPGPEVRVPVDQVIGMTCLIRGSPEDFPRRVAQLIARLGSDRFQEREAATEDLIRLGQVVIPMVEPLLQHSDLEVRERARIILKRLRGRMVAPPGADTEGAG